MNVWRVQADFRRWLAVCAMFGSVILASLITMGSFRQHGVPQTAKRSVSKDNVLAAYGKLPLVFEKNVGQTNSQVRFLARASGYTLFLTDRGAVLRLGVPAGTGVSARKSQRTLGSSAADRGENIVGLTMRGAQIPEAEGLNAQSGHNNYLIGNDPSQWHTNIPLYGRVKYRGIYPGVDAVYYGNQNRLETDYVVAPGSNPNQIAVEVTGGKKLRLNAQGDLVIENTAGSLTLRRPNTYQEIDGARREIAANFTIRGSQSFSIQVTNYDPAKELVIDPVIVYSSYLGGGTGVSGNPLTVVNGIAVDGGDKVYVTGATDTVDFPVTSGVYQTTNKSLGFEGNNAFVTVINPTGTGLVYSTFLGGTGSDTATGIGIDSSGNVFVTGSTTSLDFPLGPGPFESTPPHKNNVGSASGFFAEIGSNGTNLVYSTYLAGSGTDTANGISLGTNPNTGLLNAYIVGSTTSTNFPVTPNALQTMNADSSSGGTGPNIFLSVIDSSKAGAPGLVYSTYLGGQNGASGTAIAADAAGNAYITGAAAFDFPTSTNAFQNSLSGSSSGIFVARVDTVNSLLNYSSFLGAGGVLTTGNCIAVDSAFNAYVAGKTQDMNFPVTAGAFETVYPGSSVSFTGFVARFDTTKSGSNSLIYATYLGGNVGGDQPHGIAIDSAGNAYLTGETWSGNFPVTLGAPEPAGTAHLQHGFVFVLSADGSKDLFSTYYGTGGAVEGASLITAGLTIALGSGSTPDVFIGGATIASPTNFPITAGSYQTTLKGLQDGFVARLSPAAAQGVFATPASLSFGNQPKGTTSSSKTVTLTNNTQSALGSIVVSIIGTNAGDFSQTNTCPAAPATLASGSSCTITVAFTPSTTSAESATLNVADNAAGSPQTVSLSGTGTTPSAGVTLTPGSAPFGTVPQGQASSPQTLTLSNNSAAALTITGSGFAITGPNASDFAIKTNSCPAVGSALAAGANCTLTVVFTPSTTSNELATLSAFDSASNSPQTASLSGTGSAPTGAVTLAPASINFGNVNLNTTSAAQIITLTNSKTTALTISSISIAGTNASDFAQSNKCGTSLAANTSCTISVTFTPTTTSAQSATLSVADSDSTSPQTVALSGTGAAAGPDFTISATPTAATVNNPGTVSATVTVTSVSGFSSPVVLACSSLPGDTTCSFTQNPLTPPANGSATSTVTFSTSVGVIAGAASPVRPGTRSPGWIWLFAVSALAWLGMWKRAERGLRRTACALALLALVTLAGCSGRPSTPTGSYMVNLTGQSGSAKHTFKFALTVK